MEPQHIISIDEHHSRKVVRIEAGEGSNGHDRPAITMEQRLKNFLEEGDETRVLEEAQRTDRPQAKIQKVIFLLQDHKNFVKYFEPRVASLGPIHHGKPKYLLGEKYKRKLAYEFFKDCGKSPKLLHKVEKKIKELRECFEEEVTKKYDDESLAWILFVDGCAILQYIFCAANAKFKEFNIKTDSAAFAQHDLFLLENQVPYRLLKLLMRLSGKEADLSKSIESYIRNVSYLQRETRPSEKKEQQKQEERDPTHLLDLLRTRLLGTSQSLGKKTCRWLCRKIPCVVDPQDWQSYRNVQELKAAGIQLKRGDSNYLRNISFTRLFNYYPGFLWLPPIRVDDSMGTKFMNLIAYEMCLDFDNDFGISSYISFLDSLINEANDVKDLRKAHILYNYLGSDQEVADVINEIGTNLVTGYETYKDVKFQIQAYYENNIYFFFKLKTWIAEVIRDHFSSPWAIVGLLAASSILVLTAIQTWYTVYSPTGPCDDFCLHRP